ncbi:MAG: hypothetical protein CVU65_04925, partial [Deltaproteobacteria bacterium HGW-Deltaproteobacteria-22]
MALILTVVETHKGVLSQASLGALEVGRQVASSRGATLYAVLLLSSYDRLQQDRGRELVISAGLEDGGRLDADDVLPAVARRLCELTNAPVAEIHRVDGDLLRVVVSFDGKPFNHGRAGTVVPLLRSPCSRRAVEARAAFAVSGHADSALVPEEHYLLEKWGYRSQLSIPLLS